MARPLRLSVPEGLYHVTSRGLERRAVVRDDRDREKWVRMLDVVAGRRGWTVLAWVLMNNHFHLFLRTPAGDISAGMHDLNSGYVNYFNRKHRRLGPLFQGRFKAILVEPGAHEWELTRYIHLNPVRARIADRAEKHRWGSAPAYFGLEPAPPWLGKDEVLSRHGSTAKAAVASYRLFLEEGMAASEGSPLKDAVASSFLGSQAFLDGVRRAVGSGPGNRRAEGYPGLARRVEVDRVADTVRRVFAVEAEALSARRRRGNEARQAALFLCRRHTRLSMAELGKRFGGVSATAVCLTAKGFAERLSGDRNLAEKIRVCELAIEILKS
ncbi:MAG: transposase [Planctomycetes bacterium]|jgi:REP element-mobilizing transposase RayT|nr:transposase [Planctomycetota bacterium]